MRFQALLNLVRLILCQFSIFYELSQHVFCCTQFILLQGGNRDTQTICQVLQVLLAVWVCSCRCRGSSSTCLTPSRRCEQWTSKECSEEYTEQQQNRATADQENFFHIILKSLSQRTLFNYYVATTSVWHSY